MQMINALDKNDEFLPRSQFNELCNYFFRFFAWNTADAATKT